MIKVSYKTPIAGFLAKILVIKLKLANEQDYKSHFVNNYAFFSNDYIRMSIHKGTLYTSIFQLN